MRRKVSPEQANPCVAVSHRYDETFKKWGLDLFRQAFFLTDIKSGVNKFSKLQARSSGGERYLDTVEVVGSNPIVPTMTIKGL
jgi:hypothetical protein